MYDTYETTFMDIIATELTISQDNLLIQYILPLVMKIIRYIS